MPLPASTAGASLLLLHDHLVEGRVLAVGEEAAEEVERVEVRVVDRDRRPGELQLRQLREVVLVHDAATRRAARRPASAPRAPGREGISPKYFSIQALVCATSMSPATTSVALLGPYQRAWNSFTSARLARVQVLQRADHLPAVRMSLRVERAVDDVVGVAVRVVVDALPLLVLDDLPLLGHDVLGHRVDEEAELVGLGPERLLEPVDGHDLVVVGVVAVGRPVGRAADAGHQAVEAAGPEVLRVQEEEVLEEVGEAGAACRPRAPTPRGRSWSPRRPGPSGPRAGSRPGRLRARTFRRAPRFGRLSSSRRSLRIHGSRPNPRPRAAITANPRVIKRS